MGLTARQQDDETPRQAMGAPGRLRQGAVLGWNLAFSAGACAASWVVLSPRFATSLALGSLLESVNFRSLWHSSERILLAGAGRGAALGGFGLRFVLLAIVLGVALHAGAHPVGLLIGVSLIVPAIVLAAWRSRPLPGVPGPAPPPDDPSWDRWNPWLARERQAAGEEEEEEL